MTPRRKSMRKRLRRLQSQWKRRARKFTSARQRLRNVPARTVDAYRAARAKVTPNRAVTCSCGTTVRANQLVAHLKRHQQQRNATRRKAEGKRRPPQAATKRATGQRSVNDPTMPSKTDAVRSAAGWLAVGGVLVALPLDGIGSTWMYAAGAGCALIGGGSYAAERRWGITNHTDRESRRAVRTQARKAGCNSACMTSTLPARTCHCPCGGTTHGTAKGGLAA